MKILLPEELIWRRREPRENFDEKDFKLESDKRRQKQLLALSF